MQTSLPDENVKSQKVRAIWNKCGTFISECAMCIMYETANWFFQISRNRKQLCYFNFDRDRWAAVRHYPAARRSHPTPKRWNCTPQGSNDWNFLLFYKNRPFSWRPKNIRLIQPQSFAGLFELLHENWLNMRWEERIPFLRSISGRGGHGPLPRCLLMVGEDPGTILDQHSELFVGWATCGRTGNMSGGKRFLFSREYMRIFDWESREK